LHLFIAAALFVLFASCLLTLISLVPVQQEPFHWVFWIANQFRFQYLLIELFGLIGLVVAYRKVNLISLLVVICLCLNAAIILPYYAVRGSDVSPKPGKKAFTLLLSNVGFIVDYQPLIHYIHTVKPDILCIVELDPPLRNMLSMAGFKKEYPFRYIDDGSQLGLYSKLPIVKAALEPPDSLVGPSLNSVLKAGKDQFNLVLSHPVVPYSATALGKQERQFRKWGRTWRNRANSLLIVGDMNSAPWSPEFQAMLRQTGLRDSARGFGIQPSWPANDPILGLPIDHFLIGPNFQVLDRAIGPQVGSDHRPVLLKVAL
jgi:hypothetical protein